MTDKVCVFTATCEQDWNRYGDQYLREMERLDLPFVLHFDRCFFPELIGHPLFIGYHKQPDTGMEFEERHKQTIFDMVVAKKFDWAMAWDTDETYEKRLPERLPAVLKVATDDYDLVTFRWINLWNDQDHIRVDSFFAQGNHVKLYNLQGGRRYVFDSPITNGAKLQGPRERVFYSDLVCLHWGQMTREDRLTKKERWDRIYSKALKGDKNPIGFWNAALDEVNYPPTIVKHGYFQ